MAASPRFPNLIFDDADMHLTAGMICAAQEYTLILTSVNENCSIESF
jgi:hypothetical protein